VPTRRCFNGLKTNCHLGTGIEPGSLWPASRSTHSPFSPSPSCTSEYSGPPEKIAETLGILTFAKTFDMRESIFAEKEHVGH
jgi:hypothetical protein